VSRKCRNSRGRFSKASVVSPEVGTPLRGVRRAVARADRVTAVDAGTR
jgi:hypothetical protein